MENAPSKKCAVLGPAATFTHQAAKKYFTEKSIDVDFQFFDTKTVCRKLKLFEVDYAVLPVENIYKGFVWETFDAIYRTAQIKIIDEAYLKIRQQLVSKVTDVSKIKKIFSHYQAFRQCANHLEKLETEFKTKFQQMVVNSTGQGAQAAAEPENSSNSAAIASEEAAIAYGLNILKPDIHDAPNNTTRFWVLALKEPLHTTERNKSVFLIELVDQPGALQKFLEIFSKNKINLHWLQLLHIEKRGVPTYAFFFEVNGHIEAELKDIYRYLRRPNPLYDGRSLRLVGSFPDITPDWKQAKR